MIQKTVSFQKQAWKFKYGRGILLMLHENSDYIERLRIGWTEAMLKRKDQFPAKGRRFGKIGNLLSGFIFDFTSTVRRHFLKCNLSVCVSATCFRWENIFGQLRAGKYTYFDQAFCFSYYSYFDLSCGYFSNTSFAELKALMYMYAIALCGNTYLHSYELQNRISDERHIVLARTDTLLCRK